MRSPNKSRSRSKNHNRRSTANIINRVFDSSGPEGKVRGTPQQIIEKYQTLARDAQVAGDRVSSENFLQHAEHYIRLLGEAQREMNQRREQQEAQRREQQGARAGTQSQTQPQGRNPAQPQDPREREQPDIAVEIPMAGAEVAGDVIPDVLDVQGADSGLVETPESKPRNRRRRASGRASRDQDAAAATPAETPAMDQPTGQPVEPAPAPKKRPDNDQAAE